MGSNYLSAQTLNTKLALRSSYFSYLNIHSFQSCFLIDWLLNFKESVSCVELSHLFELHKISHLCQYRIRIWPIFLRSFQFP